MHHFVPVGILQHMLGGQQRFHDGDQDQYREEPAVFPHLRLVVGMADGVHSPEAEAQIDQGGDGHKAQQRAVPPVVELAVAEEEGHLQHEAGPQQGPGPVDTVEGKFRHHAEMPGADGLYQQHDQHQGNDCQVHVSPMVVVRKVGGQQGGNLDTAHDEDVQEGEEYGKIPLRGHPELNVGHALEGPFQLADAFEEAYHPEQG